MRRYITAGTAAAVLALAAGSAMAQIDIQQPVSGNDEFAGLNTIVTFDVAAGLAGNLVDGEALEVSFDLVDDAGTVIFGPFNVNTVGGAVNYVNAAGNAGVQVDLSTVTFASGLANTQVTGIRIKVRTATGAAGFQQANLDMANEANDEVLTAVKATDVPDLMNVFLSQDGMTAFFEFDKSLNVGAAGNDDNQTVIGMIDSTDFQIDTANSFDGTEGSPAGLSGYAFLAGSNNTIISAARNTMTADLNSGTFVRPNFDNVPAAQNQLFDIVGYPAANTAVQASTVAALSITSVDLFDTAMLGNGAADRVRVNFNLPVDPTDLGDAAFYSDFLQLAAGGDSTLSISNISADPASSSSVLLEITVGATDEIFADGLDGNGAGFTLDTDLTGDVPSSLFGTDDYATAQSIAAGDAINPALSGSVTGIVHKDQNGDGIQDGVLFVFTEPLDTTLAGDTANQLGATLTRNGGVAIHPFGGVDAVTGVMTTINLTASADPNDDDITVTGVAVTSYDADGDGTIERLEMNNALCLSFDPAQNFDSMVTNGGWDNDDMTVGAANDAPGTGDNGAVNGVIDADNSTIADANGNSIDTDTAVDDTDDIDEDTDTDGSTPVAVASYWKTGDNFQGNFDSFEETDGNVGDDDDNNLWYAIFSEAMPNNAEDPSLVSWGSGANDRFTAGDNRFFVGTDGNIVQIEDGSARGFAPGDTLTFAAGNGFDDAAGNELSGNLLAMQGTPPFNALQTDINGSDGPSAFLFDTDDPADGFADEARIFTNTPVDSAFVQNGDFTFSGGMTFDSVSVDATGTQLTFAFPSGSNLPIGNPINITYVAPANNDDPMSQIIQGTDGNSVFPGLTTVITASDFPTPDVDADDLAIMDIQGTITEGGNNIGVGAKVFGAVAVPVPKMISGTISNLDFWVDDSNSIEAFFNFIYGFEDHLYLFNDDGDIYFDNDFDDNSGSSYDQYDIAVNASNLESVTFTGKGRSYTQGDSQPERNLTLSGGKVTMSWGLLRSSGGTTENLKNFGYNYDADAIVSRAVVTGSDGSFSLHLAAPITQFYGSFGQAGWPVIIVVEKATGQRFAVSSVLNAADNNGSLLFNPLVRNTDPNNDNDRDGGSNVTFNINLDNVGTQMLYEGWSLLPFDRVSGFAKSSGDVPTLPAIQGSDNSNVTIGSPLPFDHPFNQFACFYDTNDDGMWTSADDSDFLDSLVVDINCLDHMRFVMTNKGVKVGDGIGGFIGGYAAGFFNGTNDNIGFFQYGAAGSATTVFNGTFSSSSTLGWALITAPASDSNPDAWLTANNADFLIEFNRISNGEVDVNTQGNLTGNINDVAAINAGQAYFTSFE